MKLKCVISFILIGLLGVGTALAEVNGLDLSLVGPQEHVIPGEPAVVTVYFHNTANQAVDLRDYRDLKFQLSSAVKTQVVAGDAVGLDGNFEIPAQGFLKRQYRITVPADASRDFKLSLAEAGGNWVLVQVGEAPSVKPVEPGKKMSTRVAEAHYYTLAEKITPYRSVYFLAGVDPGMEKSAFQISFKFQLFGPGGELLEKAPWLEDLYLAYTQKSLWDLKSDSAPFEDTSYMPEIFYRFDAVDVTLPGVKLMGLQTGFEHESNGRGGLESRSTNRLYVTPYALFDLGLPGDISLAIMPKAWIYVNNSETDNPDLADYRGYFELDTSIGNPEGLLLSTVFTPADKGNTVQVDLSYPISELLGESFNLYLHAQYFTGYAETLINYKERNDVFRMGISIVR